MFKGVFNTTFRKPRLQSVVTVNELKDFCKMTCSCFSLLKAGLVQAVMVTAFNRFLRVSEYTTTRAGQALLLSGCTISHKRAIIRVPSSKFVNRPVELQLFTLLGPLPSAKTSAISSK